jgi:hypothetical protein
MLANDTAESSRSMRFGVFKVVLNLCPKWPMEHSRGFTPALIIPNDAGIPGSGGALPYLRRVSALTCRLS